MSHKGAHYKAMKRCLAQHMQGVVDVYSHTMGRGMDSLDSEADVIDAMKEVLAEMEGMENHARWHVSAWKNK